MNGSNTFQYSSLPIPLFLSIIYHSSILGLGSSAAGFMVHPTAVRLRKRKINLMV
jgi:hypothetical protein